MPTPMFIAAEKCASIINGARRYGFTFCKVKRESSAGKIMFTREKSKGITVVETLRYFCRFYFVLPPADNHPCAKIHLKIRYRRYLLAI